LVKHALRKAKTNTVNSINEMDGPSGHYPVVFSLDRPPLLAGCYVVMSNRRRSLLSPSSYDPRKSAYILSCRNNGILHRSIRIGIMNVSFLFNSSANPALSSRFTHCDFTEFLDRTTNSHELLERLC